MIRYETMIPIKIAKFCRVIRMRGMHPLGEVDVLRLGMSRPKQKEYEYT